MIVQGFLALRAFVWVRQEGKGSERDHTVIAPQTPRLVIPAHARLRHSRTCLPLSFPYMPALVIPAKAGIHPVSSQGLDSRFRGNDESGLSRE